MVEHTDTVNKTNIPAISPTTEISFWNSIRSNAGNMKFGLSEISGGLGDLGTFIPLVAALSIVSGMDLAMILVIAGLANIATSFLFGLPIPVQPMKAIAVVAIAEELLPSNIAAAGVIAGAVMFVLGTSGLIGKIDRWIPKPVVRGIQLGVGMKLAFKGLTLMSDIPLFGFNSLITVLVLASLLLLERRIPRMPVALIFLLTGIGIVFLSGSVSPSLLSFGLPQFKFIIPDSSAWINGALFGALPQLPLTVLNSVIAVCALSGDLFPGRRVRVSSMATSVGLMNIIGCWFGGMPMCHGSGGLAGQYRFGARTGGSVLVLGAGKLILGLFFGSSITVLLISFPMSVLGLMILLAGIELARPVRDQKFVRNIIVVLVTAVGIITVNVLVGFLIGLVVGIIILVDRDQK